MIKVTIELLRGGRSQDTELLGEMTITNIGGTLTSGNYHVTMSKRGRASKQVWRTVNVPGFKRKLGGAYDLLCYALMFALSDRIPRFLEDMSVESKPQVPVDQERYEAILGALGARIKGMNPTVLEQASRDILMALDTYDVEPAQMALPEGE